MGHIFNREDYQEGVRDERERILKLIDLKMVKEHGAEDRVTRTWWVLNRIKEEINSEVDP